MGSCTTSLLAAPSSFVASQDCTQCRACSLLCVCLLLACRFGSLAAKQISEVIGSLRGKSISVGPSKDQTELHMTAILNPLTREAQRLSQVGSVVGACDILGCLPG